MFGPVSSSNPIPFMKAIPTPRSLRGTRRNGFSLVELMVVMVIVAVLMALTVMGASFFMAKASENKTRMHLEVIKSALEKYAAANNEQYPKSEGGSKELYQALTGDIDMDGKISSDDERKNGTYLPELLGNGKSMQGWIQVTGSTRKIIDAFGAEFQYRSPGEKNISYDLWSYGTDKKQQNSNEGKWIKSW